MKTTKYIFFAFLAMFMFSSISAWAQYVKVTAPDGTVSWVEMDGVISGTEIEISTGRLLISVIDSDTKGRIDLNEVWSHSGGRGTHYQVMSIGDYAFNRCSGLTSINIPSSVTSIGGSAFSFCSGLTSVTIPSSVMSIGEYAFNDCSSLSSIIIESGNPVYDSRNNCNAIIEKVTNTLITGCKNSTIPSGVVRIGDYAFDDCCGLISVTIPSSVTSIGRFAFSGCSDLAFIEIPNSVKCIEQQAFDGCSSLTSVTIPNSVTDIRWAVFNNCSKLTTVTIGNGLKSIGWSTFSRCSALTSIEIPNSVTNIEQSAFDGCSGLKTISIPPSVTTIGTGAFYGCSNLNSIFSYITDVFETGEYAFGGLPSSATLYVPKGLVDTYKSLSDWNRIGNIEEIFSVIPMTMSCNNNGKVLINNKEEFTSDVDLVNVKDGVNNTFEFIPEDGCKLEQVMIDGLDVTLSVKNNTLTTKIREDSKMIVMFSKLSNDINGDGNVNISDVVSLVNIILGQ